VCTAALKDAGLPSPTTEQINELATNGFQVVKTDLWLANRTDHLLQSHAYIVMTEGSGFLRTPADLDHELYIDMYSGPEDYAGTAQTGASGSITLDADLSAEETALQGQWVFLTGGTGSGQYRQVIAWDNDTKIASVNTPWSINPSSDTTYLVTTQERRLLRKDDVSNWTGYWTPSVGYPRYYTRTGTSPATGQSPAYRVFPAPDHARYACIITYGPNLTLMDEASTLFIKHLRERRVLWAQGTKVQAMQRYDDDRYMQALGIWEIMLKKYGAHNYNQTQAEGYR
jgi:hypothetical protein